MTPFEYWSRWALAGVAFLIGLALVLHFVVTHPIVEAIRGAGRH